MDYKNVRELKSSDTFGSFDCGGYISGAAPKGGVAGYVEFTSNKNITLAPDTNLTLYDNFGIKTSKGAGTNAFYFYTVRTVGDNEAPPQPPEVPPEIPPQPPEPPTNNSTPPVDNNSTPPTNTTPEPQPTESFWSKYKWIIIIVVVLVIVVAAAGIFWAKKNGKI
jgi:hypothetical protein